MHPLYLGLALVLGVVVAEEPPTPVWPEQFHAIMKQNRSGVLADVDLWYDWPGGRNLNIIASSPQNILWDNERSNGSTYYYHPATQDCKVMDMGVGLIPPTWLKGAKYLGQEQVGDVVCDKWKKDSTLHHPFVTYWAKADGSQQPIQWEFFDDAVFSVLKWIPQETMVDEQWQIPAYCFD